MDLDLLERVIVTPIAGVFTPLVDGEFVRITAGSTVGTVRSGDDVVPVLSPFAGDLVDVCAAAGERLEPFQRVAWLRVA